MAPEINDIMPKVTALLNHLGSICSILGIILTICILVKLGHIRRHFLFKARFPNLRKKIVEHRKNLSQLLNMFDSSKEQIEIELQKCRANLSNLKSKLSRTSRNDVNKIIKQIKQIKSACNPYYFSKSKVHEIYLSLIFLEQKLENLKQDIKWEPER